MPRIGGTSPYMQELAIREVKRAGAESAPTVWVGARSGFAPASMILNPIGADSAELVTGGFRRGFRLDEQRATHPRRRIADDRQAADHADCRCGHRRRSRRRGPRTTRKGSAWVMPSTRDTVNARVGDANVWIDYGRPAKRGRVIWGKLVPFDTVWRFGANEAAQIKTDKALDIGGTTVAAGYYSVWLLPSAGQSYLILNTVTKQWGTNYDASKDLVRIPVRKHVGPPAGEERFRVLVQGGQAADAVG